MAVIPATWELRSRGLWFEVSLGGEFMRPPSQSITGHCQTMREAAIWENRGSRLAQAKKFARLNTSIASAMVGSETYLKKKERKKERKREKEIKPGPGKKLANPNLNKQARCGGSHLQSQLQWRHRRVGHGPRSSLGGKCETLS
jgi:hypothetical protein